MLVHLVAHHFMIIVEYVYLLVMFPVYRAVMVTGKMMEHSLFWMNAMYVTVIMRALTVQAHLMGMQ